MNVLEIPAKEAAPYIKFKDGKLEIRGKSYDEDVIGLYSMVRDHVKSYADEGNGKLEVEIFLKYFNTASSKCLYDLLTDLKKIQENGDNIDLLINWFYLDGDDDMMEDIEDFRDTLDFEFDILPREDDIV